MRFRLIKSIYGCTPYKVYDVKQCKAVLSGSPKNYFTLFDDDNNPRTLLKSRFEQVKKKKLYKKILNERTI